MINEENPDKVQEEIHYESISDFLEGFPPNQLAHISNLSERKYLQNIGHCDVMRTPEIQLHCTSDVCNGVRFFRCVVGQGRKLKQQYEYLYLTYRCSNCQKYEKTFSLAVQLDEEESATGELYKFGELPPFGPPTPPRLIKLIGPDRDDFLKGRRCENQGLGVGAFIYYRRVVENQKIEY